METLGQPECKWDPRPPPLHHHSVWWGGCEWHPPDLPDCASTWPRHLPFCVLVRGQSIGAEWIDGNVWESPGSLWGGKWFCLYGSSWWLLETHSVGSNPINKRSSSFPVPPEAPVYPDVLNTVELIADEHDDSSSAPLALEVSHVVRFSMSKKPDLVLFPCVFQALEDGLRVPATHLHPGQVASVPPLNQDGRLHSWGRTEGVN